MTQFHEATGLALGSFGVGTYRKDGRAFPGLVQPDGTVFDLSRQFADTHAMFDDWDRSFESLAKLAAKGGETGLRLDNVEALPALRHPNMLCAGSNYRQHVAEMMTLQQVQPGSEATWRK